MNSKLEMLSPRPSGYVLAAVSGGADSVALLALLRECARAGEIRLAAAHFEHGIRGEESRADARFVKALCADWGIECHMGACDVPALAAGRHVGLEQAARDARYAFLRRVKAEIGADCIALAHHMDDQAETVLMHLLRGAGLRGASGMAAREGDLYRPLLAVRKSELIAYLEEMGIDWREDSTNAQADTPRNRLRLEALPALEAAYPGAARALCRFASIAAREDDYMAAQTAAFLREYAEQTPVGLHIHTAANGVHDAIAMRAAHRLTGLDAAGCSMICALYRAQKGRIMLENGWLAEKTGNGLYLMRGDFRFDGELPLTGEGVCDLGTLGRVMVRACDEPCRDGGERRVCVSADAVRGAVFRTRRAGDRIRPLGMSGRMKLSDYFINRRIDRPMRGATVLLARGSDVLWAAGVGLSEDARLKSGESGLELTLSGDIAPWTDGKQTGV